jgi:lipoprotein-anchoring transpeptidase ErfK/SrfK
MKKINTALLLGLMVLTTQAARAEALMSDEMAIEAGMTPVDQAGMDAAELSGVMNYERSEYVSTIPSQEDIAKVVGSHKQVIVVDKSAKGQTLRVYRDGAIVKLNELTMNPLTKKEELVAKEFVKISTGKETQVKAKSGRVYTATTPIGFFRPTMVYKMYYSGTWSADMPNAVFFRGGVAVHATSVSHYKELGTRDSGGCVRTRLEVSKQIRELVMETGKGNLPGNYKIVTESHHRNRVLNNTVSVDAIARMSGAMTGGKLNSWDTVIVVHNH